MRIILIVCMLALCGCSAMPQTPISYHIFIGGGQSNMVGAGRLPSTQSWPANIKMIIDGKLVRGREPTHTAPAAFSPLMSFAAAMIRKKHDPNYGIVLVNCAVDATNAQVWVPGSANYNNCLSMARTAIRLTGGTIDAILWSQGEGNGRSKHAADLWIPQTRRMADSMRRDLTGSPNGIPFVFVRLGDDPKLENYAYWAYLWNKQPSLAATPGFIMVDPAGLPKQGNGVHFTAFSNATIGWRLADACGC